MHEPARCSGGRVACDPASCVASMRGEAVFRVTNSRYDANPSSDRVFFRRRCNDLTFQSFNALTIQPFNVREAMARPHFPVFRLSVPFND
jgi:hypothetical protein